jgi:folate-binding protein YgfZ
MSEAVEGRLAGETPARRSPLDEAHRRAGAFVREQDGCLVPAHYGDAGAEYEAVRRGDGAGLFDLSSRGRVEVSGGEAVQFLNGMLTNDVARLGEGEWMSAAFPNPQGRLVAAARVFRTSEGFILDTEAATSERVFKALERFTLAGDFRVRRLTEETATLSVQGARAREFVRAVLGEEASKAARGRFTVVPFQGAQVASVRATHTAEDGFDLFVSASDAESLWRALAEAGARPAGSDALEVLRVEAGVPRYGVDASESNVVTEVLDEAEVVSYTKGCYTGQEIIARIHWRGHVAKKLAGLLLERDAEAPSGGEAGVPSGVEAGAQSDGEAETAQGASLRAPGAGREVGRITSEVFSPRLDARVALAVVKYDYLQPGTELRVFAGEREVCAARVSELPLVRGSWYAEETRAEA